MRSRKAFTLIELLVVIGIIAILSIVVVLTLSPAEILRQGRDSNRVSDMTTVNTALGVYGAGGGTSLGSSNVVYVSIPDPAATSTAGDQCQGLGLISLPATYSYQCSASSTYRNVNGTGWIPVNFSSVSAGSPLGSLPVDPVNTSSSRNYYTYTTNGSQYEVTSVMESQKYGLGGSNDVIGTDGGTLASVYEKGTKLGLEPLDYGDTSLVGLWTFAEGSSSIAYDYSGNNATGSWSGTATGTNGYYSPGKIGAWAGYFNGSDDSVPTSYSNLPIGNSARSVFAWIYFTGSTSTNNYVIDSYGHNGTSAGVSALWISNGVLYFRGDSPDWATTLAVTPNAWHFVGYTYSGNNMTVYYDGRSQTTSLAINTVMSMTYLNNAAIGEDSPWGGGYFSGLIDDVRIYNRALSVGEISAMYAGGK